MAEDGTQIEGMVKKGTKEMHGVIRTIDMFAKGNETEPGIWPRVNYSTYRNGD
jgi:hypothetical protein